jgi:hypothetical protein
MKIIIAVLVCFLCLEAMADTKAYTRIEQGGEIVLTDEQCKADETMLRAYWYDNEHYTEEGCWRDDDRTIYANWDKAGEMRYRKKRFKVADRW